MKKYHSPALDKGLDIIEYLSNQSISQSQTEIAQGIGKKPNEIYRMLICLEERGYIIKNVVSGKFKLSLRLFYISHRHKPLNALIKAAQFPMQELSELSKHSCHLAILDNERTLIVGQNSSPTPISLSIEVGSSFSIIDSSSGPAFLSTFDKKERMDYLNKIKEYKKLRKEEKEKLLNRIQEIESEGHSINESRITTGVIDIVKPFRIKELNLTCTMVITILSGNILDLMQKDILLHNLIQSVRKIYFNLGLLNEFNSTNLNT